jgi:hypothetical protein
MMEAIMGKLMAELPVLFLGIILLGGIMAMLKTMHDDHR